jgi:proteasome lid subunit RPN8/RPN11
MPAEAGPTKMIRIDKAAWDAMVAHAEAKFPNECCGAMIGRIDDGSKHVSAAIPMENAYAGGQGSRYELRPEDLLAAERRARETGLDLIGIFHSHPDCDAYFSKTDLENSCPWYSFVVLSVKGGKFDHAASFLPNADQTAAEKEELIWPKS